MFNRRLLSVVDMQPDYMARYDGSEQATGRGSGKESEIRAREDQEHPNSVPAHNVKTEQPTPYMQMAFAPMERRLDIAIFRALFASSARQARQFVVHGNVKVNGKRVSRVGSTAQIRCEPRD